jgi:hypothetical protein
MKDELYQIFEANKTNIFIETGSHIGEGIQRAVDIGFKDVYSMEIKPDFHFMCINRFMARNNVHLSLGDSLVKLPEILSKVNEQATFWIDAHMSMVARNCPTLEEIKIIGQHHIKNHIIIIDDMRDFGTKEHEFITVEDLMSAILDINEDYVFSIESSCVEDNVLVARVIEPKRNVIRTIAFTTQDEVDTQIRYAKNAKFGIVELGVLYGETSERFCQANQDVQIWGIDPLIPDSMNPNLIGDADKIMEICKKYGNFMYIKGYSYNIVKEWDKARAKFDYLFIDASHVYEDVKRDFEDWFKLLQKGGVVSLHDSGIGRGGPDNWPGPSQLADELMNDKRVSYIETVYSLTIFRKK